VKGPKVEKKKMGINKEGEGAERRRGDWLMRGLERGFGVPLLSLIPQEKKGDLL